MGKDIVPDPVERGVGAELPDWISGAEASRVLGWDNINSVRNRAQAGGFRWRRRPNGRLEYLRRDVEEYAKRDLPEEVAAA